MLRPCMLWIRGSRSGSCNADKTLHRQRQRQQPAALAQDHSPKTRLDTIPTNAVVIIMSLLDLLEPVLEAWVDKVQLMSERRALRLTCRSMRDAVDATMCKVGGVGLMGQTSTGCAWRE